MSEEKIYPTIPSAPIDNGNDIHEFRKNNVLNWLKEFEELRNKYKKKISRCSKRNNNMTKFLYISGIINSGSGIGAIASLLTGVGIVATIPLATITATISIANMIVSKFSNRDKKKLIYYYDSLDEVNNSRTLINALFSKCMNDGVMNEGEFDLCQKTYIDHVTKINKNEKRKIDTNQIILEEIRTIKKKLN